MDDYIINRLVETAAGRNIRNTQPEGRKSYVKKAIVITDFADFEQRLFAIFGIGTSKDAVRLLGTTSLTYQKARNASMIYFDWLGRLALIYSVNPYYLLYGSGYKKYLQESEAPRLKHCY